MPVRNESETWLATDDSLGWNTEQIEVPGAIKLPVEVNTRLTIENRQIHDPQQHLALFCFTGGYRRDCHPALVSFRRQSRHDRTPCVTGRPAWLSGF